MTGAIEPGGAIWGVAALGMLAVLLVVFVRQLRRTSTGPGPLIAAGVVAALVLVGVVLLVLAQG